MRAIAWTMSVERSSTITAAVPRPEPRLRRVSKSILASMICSAGTSGTEDPPGIEHSRLSQPPRMPPQCLSTSSRNVIPSSSSTLHGLLTWPETQNSLVPVLFLPPSPANHAPPRRRMVPATAIDSTLFTVVGQP